MILEARLVASKIFVMRAAWQTVVVVALLAGVARADEASTQLGVNFVAAGESTSMHSGGLPGGQLELAHWHGPVAFVVEVGKVGDGDTDGGTWYGAGARMALLQGSREFQNSVGARHRLHGTAWLELGVGREDWDLSVREGRLARNHVRIGIGVTTHAISAGGVIGGAQLWFRVVQSDRAGSDRDDVPETTSMMFGFGFLIGS